jgi:hypothetical protein
MDTLQKYQNSTLFEVPEHYFEQLQHDVKQRVIKEENRLKRQRKWISAISVAASISLIIVLSYFLFVNRNFDEHFYVHQEISYPEDGFISQDSNRLVESRAFDVSESTEVKEKPETLVATVGIETIVYSAVDFYVDDYETSNFCEVMYELECYYDY